MSDIEITRSGELMVAGVQAQTDAGTEFVDAWLPERTAEVQVVDSGRLVIQEDDLQDFDLVEEFVAAAKQAGLDVHIVAGL